MKRLVVAILLLTVFMSVPSYASFQAYRVAPCTSWFPNTSGLGFICQSYPQTILVPKAESISDAMKLQNDRITELEKKVAELSEACKKP